LSLLEVLPAHGPSEVADETPAGFVRGDVDIFRLVFDVRVQNDIGEPLLVGKNLIERLSKKGIVEHKISHLPLVFPIGLKPPD
jgi:hypothetical protein